MNPLEEKIIKRIAVEGPLTFETFMDMALYDPEHGYYFSDLKRIGREGDYYTSSYLHPVFGSVICRQIMEMWEFMGCPPDFFIVEMGAGEGYVCRDMMEFLQRSRSAGDAGAADFLDSISYIIVERSPGQKKTQQELLSVHADKIRWISDISEAGEICGCIFSNELLDAFPVHMVRMADKLREIYVGHDGRSFIEQTGPLSGTLLEEYFSEYIPFFEPGYVTEANLHVRGWLRDIDVVLREGFVFTIDYGHTGLEYYSEDRNRGTLLCYYRHQLSENPYDNVGQQDITAHVNFSSLKRWGDETGLKGIGYCSQGTFLVAAGIDKEIAWIAETSKDYLFELARIKKLFLPQGLGDSHKVMIQYKGDGTPRLKGFSIRNQLRLL